VTKGAVSQLLFRLERKGLVEKRVDEANASRLMVRLTNEGQLVHQAHEQLHDMICQAFVEEVGDLDEPTLALIKEFLDRVDRLIERLTEKL
jgi:DNA-binding MarR family transcriptional regulator